MQAQQQASAFYLRPAISLRAPLQGDSINFKGDKFAMRELLKTTVSLDFDSYACDRIEADTAGYVRVAPAERDNLLYLFATDLRAERFMKGKLKVSSPARFEVFVNGASKYVKDAAQDSLPQVHPAEISLRLEPEADNEIVIKLLASADDKAEPVLKCTFEGEKDFGNVPFHMAPDLKHRLSLHDTAFGRKVYSVSLSPDGEYLLTYYWDNYSAKRSRTWQELTEVKTGRIIHPNVPTHAHWMPVSSKLYYTVTGDERNDLIVFDPATMREETVMANLPDGGFSWSPTEDYLIYTSSDEGERVHGPLKRMLMPDDRIPGSRNRSYLVKYDLKTGVSERLTYGSRPVYLSDISQDGTRLLCPSRDM